MLNVERKSEAGATVVVLRGVINEEADLGSAFGGLSGAVRVKLGEVSSINSCGVREWIKALEPVQGACSLRFEELSIPIVKQFNAVMNVRGNGKVLSFKAPYFCASCDKEVQVLLDLERDAAHLAGADGPAAPPRSCPECKSELEFDEIEEKYFHFIKLQRKG